MTEVGQGIGQKQSAWCWKPKKKDYEKSSTVSDVAGS